MVKVIVYFEGNKLDTVQIPVESVKDAIIKTLCDTKYPIVFDLSKSIHKCSLAEFNKSRKQKANKTYQVHTIKVKTNTYTGQQETMHDYWLV